MNALSRIAIIVVYLVAATPAAVEAQDSEVSECFARGKLDDWTWEAHNSDYTVSTMVDTLIDFSLTSSWVMLGINNNLAELRFVVDDKLIAISTENHTKGEGDYRRVLSALTSGQTLDLAAVMENGRTQAYRIRPTRFTEALSLARQEKKRLEADEAAGKCKAYDVCAGFC